MTALTPDTPDTLAVLESHGQVAIHQDEEIPFADWRERDGYVFAYGKFVPGGHRVERVPYRAEHGPYTCQAPGCGKLYMRPEVALWTRYETALGRRMFWLGLAADAPRRSRCDLCGEASPC